MRQARVYYKNEEAGLLTQLNDGTFTFAYVTEWIKDPNKPAISLTMPKTNSIYQSEYLFPFFFHLLPEGANRQVICRNLRIDSNDDFGLLLNTAQVDTIGAVTIQRIEERE